jgi:hypothetical protein
LARVAQSVERSAVNRKVGGSNPPVSDIFITIIIKYYQASHSPLFNHAPQVSPVKLQRRLHTCRLTDQTFKLLLHTE